MVTPPRRCTALHTQRASAMRVHATTDFGETLSLLLARAAQVSRMQSRSCVRSAAREPRTC
eukprot:5125061-Pyramimonas_sp.AAC.1